MSSDDENTREVDNPFDEPNLSNERGIRRVSRAAKIVEGRVNEFRIAYEKGAESNELSDRLDSDDVRTKLVAEIEELKQLDPDSRQESGVMAVLERACEVLAECPAFSPGMETTNASPANVEGVVDITSQSQPNRSESVSIISVSQRANDSASSGPIAGPSGADDLPAASSNESRDEEMRRMSEKLFDLGQKVMELENELETEKRSHAGECRDMRERFEREFEKQERDYEQRERAYERKIDELARALEREREKHKRRGIRGSRA